MLREQLNEALKAAMKDKQTVAVATLRLILAALKDRDIAARSKGNSAGIGDDEILGMLQSMIKQRRDSIEMYEKGGRLELAEQESAEIAIIESFLPQQMDEEAMNAAIDAIIADVGAAGIKDMGKVMGALKGKFAGQMDFGKASGMVKDKLT